MADDTHPIGSLSSAQRSVLRELLVASTSAYGRTADVARMSELSCDPVTRLLPEAAALHRVSGIVLRGLDDAAPVDPDVLRRLGSARSRAAFHHLLVLGALSTIGRALDDKGIAWVVMKGPVAASLLYMDAGDRTYADLDVLVARQDYRAAMRVFEQLGYAHATHDWALADRMLAGQVGMSSAVVNVDLHWHLHYSEADRRPWAFPIEAMIERARQVNLSASKAPTFDRTDTLITLAFHAARSDGHRLLWMKDIERAMAIEQPDLDEVVRRSRSFRCAPPVGVILERARRIVGADVPQEIVHALLPRSLRLADAMAVRLIDPIQLEDRENLTRWLCRSVRPTVTSSIVDVPSRAVRAARRFVIRPPENETDDVGEKERYLDSVTRSTRR